LSSKEHSTARSTERRKRQAATWIKTILIWGFAALYLFPLMWTFSLSIKSQVDALSFPPKFIFSPTFSNYLMVWKESEFLKYSLNSLIIALSSTVIGLTLATPAAYVLSRKRYKPKGSKYILFGVLSTRVVPQITFMIPFFILFRKLRLIDTHISVIIMHLTIILGFGMWMMKSYFQEIPFELEESALIDGCTYFSAFRRIILPLGAPGIATTAIFSFNYSWNEFLYSLILTGKNTKTVPLGVYNWVGYEEINWGGLTATAILALVPILIFYGFVQRGLVRGLTMGAVKG
jgi:multiple sugar transport system permease protein